MKNNEVSACGLEADQTPGTRRLPLSTYPPLGFLLVQFDTDPCELFPDPLQSSFSPARFVWWPLTVMTISSANR